MYRHQLIQLGQGLQAFEVFEVVHVAEVIADATIATGRDEAFIGHHANLIELMQPIQVVGNQATKLGRIDGELAFCR
ncbi:hypothetical protein D3C80_1669750 [compost metagenome]